MGVLACAGKLIQLKFVLISNPANIEQDSSVQTIQIKIEGVITVGKKF